MLRFAEVCVFGLTLISILFLDRVGGVVYIALVVYNDAKSSKSSHE